MQLERARTLLIFCAVSLVVHIALVMRGPSLHVADLRSDKPHEIEVTLAPVERQAAKDAPLKRQAASGKRRAAARKQPASAAGSPKVMAANSKKAGRKGAPGPRTADAERAGQGGLHQVKGVARVAPGVRSGKKNAGERRVRIARRQGGGGAPATTPLLTGRDGATGPKAKPEELLFAGGGAGGANLPHAAPRLGGGGGQEILAVPGAARDPLEDEKPGLGPGHAGGAGTGSGGGVGFVDARGVGAQADGRSSLAALRVAAGSGLGAGQGNSLGTTPPGGGKGTGAELPGTGGEGLGYGRGKGVGIGNGSGIGVGDGDGSPIGNARGVPFGDLGGLLRGGGGGDGGDGGDGGRGNPFSDRGGGSGGDGPLRVVYVLDVSQSMKEGDKLGQAKQALKKALSELRPTDRFNIVYFFEDVWAFEDKMSPASAENVARGQKFVEGIGLGPGTNLSAAIGYALGQKEATDIFVLSDGEPNRGIEDPARLRKMIQRDNKRLKAHISTLALGLGERFRGMELLRSIAEENQGRFRYVDLSGGAREK